MKETMKLILVCVLTSVVALSIAHLFQEKGRILATEIFQLTCEERGVIELSGKRYECSLIEEVK